MTKKPLITVSILLKGEQLDPEFVSQTLGIAADKSQKKGEIRGANRPDLKPSIARTGAWWSRLDNKSREIQTVSGEVSELLDELLARFRKRQEPLNQIAGVDQAFIDILILGDMEEELGCAEFILSKDQVLRASQLGLAIWITTSFADDE